MNEQRVIVRDSVMKSAHLIRQGFKKDVAENCSAGSAKLELAKELGIIDSVTENAGYVWLDCVARQKIEWVAGRDDREKFLWLQFDSGIRGLK